MFSLPFSAANQPLSFVELAAEKRKLNIEVCVFSPTVKVSYL